jgi:hypothetical protein
MDRIPRKHALSLVDLAPLRSNDVDDNALELVRDVLASKADHQEKLSLCNRLLNMHGVEVIPLTDSSDDWSFTDERIRMCPPYSYLNTGDSYAATLVRDHREGAWMIAGWADVVEEEDRLKA